MCLVVVMGMVMNIKNSLVRIWTDSGSRWLR